MEYVSHHIVWPRSPIPLLATAQEHKTVRSSQAPGWNWAALCSCPVFCCSTAVATAALSQNGLWATGNHTASYRQLPSPTSPTPIPPPPPYSVCRYNWWLPFTQSSVLIIVCTLVILNSFCILLCWRLFTIWIQSFWGWAAFPWLRATVRFFPLLSFFKLYVEK